MDGQFTKIAIWRGSRNICTKRGEKRIEYGADLDDTSNREGDERIRRMKYEIKRHNKNASILFEDAGGKLDTTMKRINTYYLYFR